MTGRRDGGGEGERAPDLVWEDVRGCFDPDGGTLPDVVVHGASAADWQAVLDLVAERGWEHEYAEGVTVLPVPRAGVVHSRPAGAECPELRVWPAPDMLAIFRFYSVDEIDFDVDVREVQGQERLDEFCGFLRAIGRRLGKPVAMYAEGGRTGPALIGFDPGADRVVLLREGRTGLDL
ncbi:hypothetical protein [Streptomyces sp. LUP30]|uniref:hypothetical protein n=1 Tax=Streptomyces sp. LUP30 TaxID=1890285 RepID=UPI000851A0BC|nr:hypothetical protein [Streptomyces sp. LUP30]